ncbi:predicted protein [Histoplasma mississippiense (nom. inval.)]|uniref:predicted protein n=1 Tax=Ajellomyces capsulatus (strain NAm1 / WU24) TaxID=2059318 RepID=UPI000157D286|nr:predicted protein [Histoplasma mississippiense (nom. inval.)]EDN04876.1 predicted protein [Histoplasma mississippiense (nom. inval.)]
MELEFFVTSQANPPETLSHRESRELCKTIELIYARLIIAEDIISALEAGHYLEEAFGGRICSLRDIKRRLRPYQQHDRHESRPQLHKCPAARCQHQFETADNLPRHIRNTADLSHRTTSNLLPVKVESKISIVEGTAADKVDELPFHVVMQPSSTGSEMSAFDYSVNSIADPSSIHSSYIGPSGSIFDYSVDSMADFSSIHSSSIGPSRPIFDDSVNSIQVFYETWSAVAP